MSPRPRRQSQAQKLDAALRERRMSMRALARKIVGPEASKDRVDSKRAQISKWRKGPGGFSDATAWALADALGYPSDHFVKPRKLTLEEEFRSEQERNRREFAALKRQVAALRSTPPPADESERKSA